MKKTLILIPLAIAGALFALNGCNSSTTTTATKAEGETFGKPVDPKALSVKMKDLLDKPAEYKGKLVVLEGKIGAVGCVDCGGLIVTDKTYRLPIEPEHSDEFKLPVKTGALIKFWGVVAQAEGDPNGVQVLVKGATVL